MLNSVPSSDEYKILCVGEVLWDIFPSERCLGGAPFNVACHLRALGQSVAIASRVGNDDLGREIMLQASHRGLRTDLIQVDPLLPSGQVKVCVADPLAPTYRILQPAAWDRIAMNPLLQRFAHGAGAIVFGSLTQRDPIARGVIHQLIQLPVFRVFDVNLRPPAVERSAIEFSLHHSDLVKVNEHELELLSGWFGHASEMKTAAFQLQKRFGLRMVCVTRGANGAALLHDGTWREHPGFKVKTRDCVGAGDAFLAAILDGFLRKIDDDELLERANAIAAYVATQRGSTPALDFLAIRQMVSKSGLSRDTRQPARNAGTPVPLS